MYLKHEGLGSRMGANTVFAANVALPMISTSHLGDTYFRWIQEAHYSASVGASIDPLHGQDSSNAGNV